MLSPNDIQEFKQLYHEEFGIELTDEVATHKAQKLLELVRILSRPPE